jgi:phosphoribosylaminoimidazole-succinocarboxamide synthase
MEKTYVPKYVTILEARTLDETNIDGLGRLYRGKVRDNYFKDGVITMIATDRISCFDHVLSRQIPFKGQVLTQIMKEQAGSVSDIIPHHIIDMPDPQVLIVKDTAPFDVEMIVRGYITGSLWRDYIKKGPEQAGAQYGIVLPQGLKANQQFEEPIVTPTTKAKAKPGSTESHHDEPVSREEIITKELLRDIEGVGKKGEPNPFHIEETKYDEMARNAVDVFKRGQETSLKKRLILVDTKYELGELDGTLYLIDEVHTPDSSRFWHANTYETLFQNGAEQKAMSKEFVRDWLMQHGYDKNIGEKSLSTLTQEIIIETATRYIELCEMLTGKEFVPGDMTNSLETRITKNLQDSGWM